jgi:DMSO reductase anchor subunit
MAARDQVHGTQADPLNQRTLTWVLVVFLGGSVLFGTLRRLTEDESTGVVLATQLGALALVIAIVVVLVRRLR